MDDDVPMTRQEVIWMIVAKAIVGAITAFLGLLVAREVAIDPYIEAALVGVVAFLTVYAIPNRA